MKKLMIYILIVFIIVLGVNFMYLKLNKRDEAYTNSFKNMPDKIDICNFGSSHGFEGYNYEDIEERYSCFNFALVSQTLSYDYRLLKCYQNKLAEKALVFITISYFSLYGQDEVLGEDFESKNKRYYKILPPKYIKNYDFMTDLFVKFPSLVAYEDLIFTLLGRHVISESKDSWWSATAYEIEDMDENVKAAYTRHIIEGKFDENGKRIKNEEEIDALYQMIQICQEHEAIPVLITTPYLKEYTDEVKKGSPEFLIEFYEDIQKIVDETGVAYYDYAMDERFYLDYNLFLNGDHLNKEGARKFVDILMKEVGKEKLGGEISLYGCEKSW